MKKELWTYAEQTDAIKTFLAGTKSRAKKGRAHPELKAARAVLHGLLQRIWKAHKEQDLSLRPSEQEIHEALERGVVALTEHHNGKLNVSKTGTE